MKKPNSFLERAHKIREEAKQALSENPNSMIKYRLEMMMALAEDMIKEAQASGQGGHPGDRGPKEAQMESY